MDDSSHAEALFSVSDKCGNVCIIKEFVFVRVCLFTHTSVNFAYLGMTFCTRARGPMWMVHALNCFRNSPGVGTCKKIVVEIEKVELFCFQCDHKDHNINFRLIYSATLNTFRIIVAFSHSETTSVTSCVMR